ncbi:hypothetical protein GGX14DRAFT_452922 [Mycena pura]|uniref:Uncharacterized protein n=1 Tax=Mycena pura TaxID=153505 RepID=A0AAD6VHK5_9AGAR|nr:hypothetical protein GGX14DRAFT_452922 [Mycena pura]
MTLVQFVIAVVKHFSAKALREPECHHNSIPETQYQNELCRAAWKVTGGHGIWLSHEYGTSSPAGRIWLSHEYGTSSPAGRIDFYVRDLHNWGIEVLRQGDRIEEHLRRFSPGGAYHTSIQKGTMKECGILDFTISDCDLKALEEGLLLA